MDNVRSIMGRPALVALMLPALLGGFGCAGNVDTGGDITETASSLSGIPSTTTLGNLSLAFGEAPTANETHVWRDVNRLATGVWSNSGDALQINVSAKVTGKGSMWLRVLVDGQVAQPSDVQFFNAGSATTSDRTFTFIAPNMTAGFHVVRVQWLSGDKYIMEQRSLAVRSVRTAPGQNAQLSFVVPASGPSVHARAGAWNTIPGLSTTMSSRLPMNLQITFAAEMGVSTTRLIARALVDGAPAEPGDITMEQSDHQTGGTRSMTFSKVKVPAGTHTITMQWYCDAGGDVWVGDRTLSVYGTYSGERIAEGGAMASPIEGSPQTITSSSWLIADSGAVDVGITASTGVTVSASLEHQRTAGSGALHVRARLDGAPMKPDEYVLDREGRYHTQTLLFSAKGASSPGYHAIILEYHVDAGTTAQVRDIGLVASAVRRTGGDFAQAQPYENHLVPQQGSFNLLTICLDPIRPDVPPLTDQVVNNVVDGADGGISIRGLFSEMSGGRYTMGAHYTLGCGTPTTYHPPVEHQGLWYWQNPGGFVQMRKDAFALADADFDFSQFDYNHDGKVLANELAIHICIPQWTPDGQAGQYNTYDVDGTTLGLASVDCYMAPDDVYYRTPSVGVIAHETGHQVLNAYDLYGPSIIPMPDELTLMASRQPIHLSAYEKLHHGWVAPALIDMTSWTTGTVDVPPVETGKEVLIIYDPLHSRDEYFIIEYRSKSAALGITNYDSYLLSSMPEGLELWHIVEDRNLLDPYVAPPVPGIDPIKWRDRINQYGWVAGGIQSWGRITPGNPIALVWSDGNPSGFTVTGVANSPTGVTITKN